MRALRISLLILISFILIFSCKKEKSFENPVYSITPEWEFKEGKQYKGKVDTAFIEDAGNGTNVLMLAGTSVDGREFLSIEIDSIAGPGTYKNPNVHFQYTSTRGLVYENYSTAQNAFTIVITKIDSISVSGTFEGKVKDSTGADKPIAEGKFTGKLKKSVHIPPPAVYGQLTFWASSSCGAGGNIIVKLSNNQSGVITGVMPNEPTNCNASGTAYFTLPAGSYTWKAYCGTQDSAAGVVTVLANQCIRQQVIFGGSANCRISDIGFYDLTIGIALGSIHTIYNGNQVSNVQLHDSINHVIVKDFVLTYPGSKIQIDNNQYFVLDASGRIAEFHGFEDPTEDTTKRILTRYSYDASGYMNKFTIEYADTPGVISWQGILEYTNGNLTRITENNPSNLSEPRIETKYDYNNLSAKDFVQFIPLSEIIYFQTAINVGKTSQNQVTTETVIHYGSAGNVVKTEITSYDHYGMQSFSPLYVKSFQTHGDGNTYGSNLKFVLQYHCF